jgi:hypothetical protein
LAEADGEGCNDRHTLLYRDQWNYAGVQAVFAADEGAEEAEVAEAAESYVDQWDIQHYLPLALQNTFRLIITEFVAAPWQHAHEMAAEPGASQGGTQVRPTRRQGTIQRIEATALHMFCLWIYPSLIPSRGSILRMTSRFKYAWILILRARYCSSYVVASHLKLSTHLHAFPFLCRLFTSISLFVFVYCDVRRFTLFVSNCGPRLFLRDFVRQ